MAIPVVPRIVMINMLITINMYQQIPPTGTIAVILDHKTLAH